MRFGGATPHHESHPSHWWLTSSRQALLPSPIITHLFSCSYHGYAHKMGDEDVLTAPSPPLFFPTSSFKPVRPAKVLGEEWFEKFKKGRYYPADIGDVICSRYRIFGKLGFGTTSTVWLACDLE